LNTTGSDNTASGFASLSSDTTGSYNTASGYYALAYNITGNANTAFGEQALYANSTGNGNTASGDLALFGNTTGSNNTATGEGALFLSATGGENVAVGGEALHDNESGNNNVAVGYQALDTSRYVNDNTAVGNQSLFSDTSGSGNTAVGDKSLYANSSGSQNIAIGIGSGDLLTTGSFNIDIGNSGAAGDGGKIKIGASGKQTETFIAGIVNSKITGAPVYITPSGQLGVLASAERYKTAIAPLGSTTRKLVQLRPVSFHLKTDPTGTVQYGLIAEEVERVYPELVIRDEAGKIQGVRYDELAPMLLNEVQKQAAEIRHLKQLQEARFAADEHTIETQGREMATIRSQSAEIRELKKHMADLENVNARVLAALGQFGAHDAQLAMR